LLILAAVLSMLVYGMISAMLGTILPELSARFTLTPRQNGTMATTQALGLMVASVGVGPLLDDFGQKIGILLGLAIIAAVLLALPRSGGFRSVAWMLFLLGVGGGTVTTGINSLVSDVDGTHRAVALTLVNIFFGLGGLATPFLSANLLGRNWVRLCHTIAVLALGCIAIQAAAPMTRPTEAGRFLFADVGAVLVRPELFLLGLFMFLYVGCEVGIWNWLVRHLITQGIPESRALNILSLGFALGLLLGRLAVSGILLRVSSIDVTLAASIAMTVVTLAMVRSRSASAAWVLVFLTGLAMSPVFPTTLAMTGDAFPRMSSTAIGFVVTCGWAGLAASSRLIGGIAGGDPRRLRKALLVIPVSSAAMIAVNLGIRATMR
jgi:fucose permease